MGMHHEGRVVESLAKVANRKTVRCTRIILKRPSRPRQRQLEFVVLKLPLHR